MKPYQIPSESMEPTLEVGQRVLVNRFIYRFTDPKVGDVVVFHPPLGAERNFKCGVRPRPRQSCPRGTPERSDDHFIKRIVAGPGDTIAVVGGHPVLNGEPITDEGFVSLAACQNSNACEQPVPITVPPDHFFMMGDNRGASDDSRSWGPVPREWLIGKAFATYWPPNRVGGL